MDLVNLTEFGSDQISRVHLDDTALTVVRQLVRPVPDEDWTTTDAAGHMHAYGSPDDPFPTMERISEGWAYPCETCSDCGDIEHYHLACKQCGEKLWPAPSGPGTQCPEKKEPGAYLYWIGEQPATQQEARAFTDAIRVADPDRWERLLGWMKLSAGLLLPAKRPQHR